MLARGTLRGVLRFPDPPLADDAITLRPKALADADALVAACQDPEIPRWTRVPRPYRRAHAIEWIEGSGETLAKGTSIDWLAVDAGDTVLASVGLMEIDSERGYGEIGYWVAREARARSRDARGPARARLGAPRARAGNGRDHGPRGKPSLARGRTVRRLRGDTRAPPVPAGRRARGRLRGSRLARAELRVESERPPRDRVPAQRAGGRGGGRAAAAIRSRRCGSASSSRSAAASARSRPGARARRLPWRRSPGTRRPRSAAAACRTPAR